MKGICYRRKAQNHRYFVYKFLSAYKKHCLGPAVKSFIDWASLYELFMNNKWSFVDILMEALRDLKKNKD